MALNPFCFSLFPGKGKKINRSCSFNSPKVSGSNILGGILHIFFFKFLANFVVIFSSLPYRSFMRRWALVISYSKSRLLSILLDKGMMKIYGKRTEI